MIRTRAELMREVSAAAIAARCRRGQYTRVLPGIYAVGTVTQRTRCEAVLAWLPEAVLSHRTAAWLWDMLPEPESVEATVPRGRYRATPEWLRLSRRELRPDSIDEVWGLPVTTQARTLLDCVPILPDAEAGRMVDNHARAVAPALSGLTTGQYGSPHLREQLRCAAFDAASEPERLFARALARRGLHLLSNQPIGQYVGDLVDERSRTIIEIDGREFHSDSLTFRRDRRRQNALLGAGWFVLRYAAADVYSYLDACVEEAVRVIRRRRRSRR
ncbi:DUF559 domain-containing protein [Nocardia kruczakiae]|uniref:DUF559 domain-containing protein n=1 Tax=Nocardia kruczakiae TaxID=261477 RepID=UPI001FE11137|nr:DUF559 domain-containing protein [Nocardia kruczakiae]